MLVEQIRRFGPFNDSFEDFATVEHLSIYTGGLCYMQEKKSWLPFFICEDNELARSDRDFIAKPKMIILDQRDRPTAKELFKIRGSIREAAERTARKISNVSPSAQVLLLVVQIHRTRSRI